MQEIESPFQIYKFYLLKMFTTNSISIFSNIDILFFSANDKVYILVSASLECLNDGVNIQEMANMYIINSISATLFFQSKISTLNSF